MVAKKYKSPLPLGDLVSEGNLGLIRAAEMYKPGRCRFSTYAVFRVRQHISRAIQSRAAIIRTPVYMLELIGKRNKAEESLRKRLGREPRLKELAKKMGISQKKLRKIDSISGIVSLDSPLTAGDSASLMSIIPRADSLSERPADIFLKERAAWLLSKLNPKERKILTLRFGIDDGEPKTLGAIGRMLGVTREFVRILEKSAITKLRAYI